MGFFFKESMSLTQRQIESFEQNGYLVLENFVSKQECEKLRPGDSQLLLLSLAV